ncbi:MAG: AsmA-like C-terminal region-containing protein [Tunicatimonas sp.]
MIKKLLTFAAWLLVIAVGGVLSVGYYYQDHILQRFVQEANRYLSVPVQAQHLSLTFLSSFPRVSVALEEVQIAGHPDAPPLADVARIKLSFDLWALLQGDYVIDRIALSDGEIYLHVDAEGRRNYTIFRPKSKQDEPSTSRSPLAFRLQTIVLDQIQISYADDPIQHHTELVTQSAEAVLEAQGAQYDVQLRGEVLSRGIRVGEATYFAQKEMQIDSRLSYNDQQRHWQIMPSLLHIADGEFSVSGHLDQAQGTSLNLAVGGQNTDVQTLLSLLPSSITKPLLAYRSTGEVYFKGTVIGQLPRPRVDVRFGCQNASLYHPEYQKQLRQLRLTGHFTNGAQQNLATSELSLQDVAATLDGKPIGGRLLVRNFRDYYLEARVQTDIDAQSVLSFYPFADVRTARGNIAADVTLAGRLQDMRSTQLARRQRTRSSGSLTLHNFHVQLAKYPLPFRGLNGNFTFQDNDVAISDFSGYVGHSHFALNGFFRNAIAYALSPTQPLKVDADLHSSLVDLDELLSGTMDEPGGGEATEAKPYRFHLDPRLAVNFNCRVDRLKFRRFRGTQLRSRLSVDQQVAHIRSLSVQAAGGKASASGTVHAQQAQAVQVRATSRFEGIHADSLFYIFEDFQQDFLTARHLKGSLFSKVDWVMNFDRALRLHYPSLLVTADTRIVDGELNNFAPIQEISRFVDDEHLSQLRFGPLSNRIRIANERVYIPPMEVHNNVSSITVEGTHTFSNVLDYRFAMPLRDVHLRSRRARERAQQRKKSFGEIAPDDAKPMQLFLTARGPVADYKVAYDFEKAKLALKENLKEEKQERRAIFKNKGRKAAYQVELEEEYFEFDQ